jgi:acetyl-CoA acetyltransferase
MKNVIVAGVGMTQFVKPGSSQEYDVMAQVAVREALADSGLEYSDLQQAYCGYVYGDSTCGQRALYGAGQSGIPVVNVNNNCATGSSALWLARQAVASGQAKCVLALGFEKMMQGALGSVFEDRIPPLANFVGTMDRLQGFEKAVPPAAQFFGGAGREYQEKFGASDETFAKISVKARLHAEHNERALFRDPLTVKEVLGSQLIYGPLTRFQCCPPTCGAAAAVICSETFARRHSITHGVEVLAQSLVTDTMETFRALDGETGMMNLVGYGMTAQASSAVYEDAGIDPNEVDVVELHDCFTSNELISYEALKLTPEGTAEQFICDGDNTYGGKVVTNPSGGLLSKGHPLGATGLAQCAELVWQLRSQAGLRQVENARIGLQHNIGLGGACVVTLYRRA